MGVDRFSLERAAHRLRVDGWAADVITALRAGGVEPVLLKGPVIGEWLYPDDPSSRPYVDVDLLVSPEDQPEACAILLALGFEMLDGPMPAGDEPHARAFERISDGAAVDLHRVLHGMEGLSAHRVWQELSDGTGSLRVANVDVAIPSLTVRTLHLALHVSPRNGPGSKAWSDLRRGLEVIDLGTWEKAARLAESLGIAHEFGYRLSLVPEAEQLVRQLRLPRVETSRYAAMRFEQEGGSGGLVSLLKLDAQTGLRRRLGYAATKLFPSDDVLRQRYRFARRSRAALLLARMWRPMSCAIGLPASLLAWRRHRPRP